MSKSPPTMVMYCLGKSIWFTLFRSKATYFKLNEKTTDIYSKQVYFKLTGLWSTEGQSAWNDRKYKCMHIKTFLQTFMYIYLISQKVF